MTNAPMPSFPSIGVSLTPQVRGALTRAGVFSGLQEMTPSATIMTTLINVVTLALPDAPNG